MKIQNPFQLKKIITLNDILIAIILNFLTILAEADTSLLQLSVFESLPILLKIGTWNHM